MTDALERAAKAAWWQFRLKRMGLTPADTAEIAALKLFEGELDTWPDTMMSANANDFRDVVRAVLMVIREPDEGLMGPFAYLEPWQMPDTKARFTAMIDEMLKPTPRDLWRQRRDAPLSEYWKKKAMIDDPALLEDLPPSEDLRSYVVTGHLLTEMPHELRALAERLLPAGAELIGACQVGIRYRLGSDEFDLDDKPGAQPVKARPTTWAIDISGERS